MFPLPSAAPMPEVVPSRDESVFRISPNYAQNVELCKEVTKYLVGNYWLPYENMQLRFWPLWRQLDEMWRAKVELIDLDLPVELYGKKDQEATKPNPRDGFTQKISPTDMHQQWDALLKIYLSISFDGGSIPVGAVKPDYVFETLYDPIQQSVEAFNSILSEQAHETGLKNETRKNFHSFLCYGHAWAWADPKRDFEDVEVRYTLGLDMQSAQGMLAMLSQQYQGQTPTFEQSENGPIAVFRERRVKELYTSFKHLNVDDVFTDLMLPCDDMDKHPCPWVRQRVGEFAVEENDYDPESNPFGWLNVDTALKDGDGQYLLTEADEGPLRQRLMHRYNMSDQTLLKPEHSIKQLWTCYPKLRISEQGKFTTDKTVKARRFIAQFYGNPRKHGMTCLRLQEMPKGMSVPLIFSGDMIEDTACALPMSKGEVAMNDFYVKAECESLFLRSKRQTIRRGWKKKVDSLMRGVDCNKPDVEALFESNPAELERIEASQLDETITLAPYIAERAERIKEIVGARDQILGELAQGRRSWGEVSNAIDASKNPVVVTIDSYNTQALGRWAHFTRQNLDLFGDRDFIRKKTGREYFGKLRFKTAAAEEYVRKLTRISNNRSMMEMLPNLLPVMPQLQPVVTTVLQNLFNDQGMADVVIPDDGLMEAQQEAMSIVSMILGDAKMLPPMPDDPDEIFIRVFSSAIRKIQLGEDYWSGKCADTLPILQVRLQMQQQQAQMKMLQQIQMQQMLNPQPEQKRPGSSPKDKTQPTPGGQQQAAQGPVGAAA